MLIACVFYILTVRTLLDTIALLLKIVCSLPLQTTSPTNPLMIFIIVVYACYVIMGIVGSQIRSKYILQINARFLYIIEQIAAYRLFAHTFLSKKQHLKPPFHKVSDAALFISYSDSVLLQFHPTVMRPGCLQSCPALPGGRHRRNALRQILRKLPVCKRR